MAIALLACACNAISGAADLSIGADVDASVVDAAPPPARAPDEGSGAAPGSGSATERVSVITPDGLDFGELACGAHAPPPRHVEIESRAAVEIGYHAELADGTLFAVALADGLIPSGGKVVLDISSPGLKSDGPVGENKDVLTITTNALDDTPHVFDVRLNLSGAILKVSPSGTIAFGTVSSTESTKLTIRNDGNLPGTLEFKFTTNTGNTWSIEPSVPAVLMPGTVEVRTVVADPPNSGGPTKNGTLTFSSTSQLCGSVPAPISCTARINNN